MRFCGGDAKFTGPLQGRPHRGLGAVAGLIVAVEAAIP